MKPVKYHNTYSVRAVGFSLVELLIAMTLGLFLTVGIFTVFTGIQRSSTLNTEIANMQESIRFALNVMTEDVRMAGFQGCLDLNGGTVDIIAKDPPSLDLQATIIGGSIIANDQSWSPAPALGSGTGVFTPPTTVTPRAGTHTLAVQFAKTPGSALSAAQMSAGSPNATGPLILSRSIDVEVENLALISTCEAGEIFRISALSAPSGGSMVLSHGTTHNTRASFQQIYGTPANKGQTLVMPFTTRIYFVADSGDDRRDGSPLFALYQQTMPFDETLNPPVMLVEGVENMRVQFAIGAANGQLRYVSADDAAYDPTQIRSVHIGLLMSSYDSLLDSADSKTYTLVDDVLSASATDTTSAAFMDDKRLRMAFNTTANVRNRRARN